MRSPLVTAALVLTAAALLATPLSPARADDPSPPATPAAAAALFRAGDFAAAARAYTRVLERDPTAARALTRLGEIALLSNRLDEARDRLRLARRLDPDDPATLSLLAETYTRQGDYLAAVPLLRASGRDARAKALASFRDLAPYEIHATGPRTSLKFVITDPLPLVRVRVNGGDEVNFFLDTGAADVVLDTDFARERAVPLFGREKGSFAGGKEGGVGQGRLDSLTLGDWTVKNLPIQVLPTRPFSGPVFGGRRVDGILGTVLFSRLLATIDYPRGELTLRRRGPGAVREVERSGRTTSVPFWMAGDHFMVARGRVNGRPPVLLFVDTGAAGVGLTLPESSVKQFGIRLHEDQAAEGLGGGGKVRSVPFVAREVSLGDVTARDLPGSFDGPFAFENAFGFRLAGIVSHAFFKPYALTLDFDGMRLLLTSRP